MGKISGYPEDTSPTDNDLFVMVDAETGANKKVKGSNLPGSGGEGGGSSLWRPIDIATDNTDGLTNGTLTQLTPGGPNGEPLYNLFLTTGVPLSASRAALDLGRSEDWPDGTEVMIQAKPNVGGSPALGASVIYHSDEPGYLYDLNTLSFTEFDYTADPTTVVINVDGTDVPVVFDEDYVDSNGMFANLVGTLAGAGVTYHIPYSIWQVVGQPEVGGIALVSPTKGASSQIRVESVTPDTNELAQFLDLTSTDGVADWLIGPSHTMSSSGEWNSNEVDSTHTWTDTSDDVGHHTSIFVNSHLDGAWLSKQRKMRPEELNYTPPEGYASYPAGNIPSNTDEALDVLAGQFIPWINTRLYFDEEKVWHDGKLWIANVGNTNKEPGVDPEWDLYVAGALENDEETPGNYKYYGTDGTGTKGWKSGTYSEFVYNSSGAQPLLDANIYNDWDELYAALQSQGGRKVITFEQDETLPTGTYDLGYVRFRGSGRYSSAGASITVTMPNGFNLAGNSWADGGLENWLKLIYQGASSALTYSASTGQTFYLGTSCSINTTAASFFSLSSSGKLTIELAGPSSTLQNGGYEPVTLAGTPTILVLAAGGYASIGNNLFRGNISGGSGIISVISPTYSSGIAARTDANLTGAMTVDLRSNAALVEFDTSGTDFTATTVQLAIEEAKAYIPATPPANASSQGVAGSITYDSNYIYMCVATNTWKRVAIATW